MENSCPGVWDGPAPAPKPGRSANRPRRIAKPYAGTGAPATGSVGMRFTSLYSR